MSDTSAPEYWDQYYARRETPWDFGGVPAALREFLIREKPGRALIPGCGTGQEAIAFARAGWDVLAIDFSIEAVRLAQIRLGDNGRLIQHGDFFALDADGTYDVIYERTFLCAIPPGYRAAYASKMAELLRPGGQLAGFFFFGPADDPPPHPLRPGELSELLGAAFTRVEDAPVSDPLPFFVDKERWQVWTRKETNAAAGTSAATI